MNNNIDLNKLAAIADRVEARGLFNAACDIRDWIQEVHAAQARASQPKSDDDALIIDAVTRNNVYGVLPNSASTMSIGRAVLAAYRALSAGASHKGQEATNQAPDATNQAGCQVSAAPTAPTGCELCNAEYGFACDGKSGQCGAAPAAAVEPSEILAWAHEDGRVVAASTMDSARRDGGAMRSSLSGYTIPLGRVGAPKAEQAREGANEQDADPARCDNCEDFGCEKCGPTSGAPAQPKDTTDTTKGQA